MLKLPRTGDYFTMTLINTTDKLVDFCKILQTQKFITIDSEFLREHYYYPLLCLVQVGYEGGYAVIDPISKIDMTPFFEILQNPNITKVFHAGKQDVEIFYNLTGKLPSNIFDTQIGAMVCGFGENISYGSLVKSITGTELDKSCRLTDWSIRPLDEDQIAYATNDVTYLVDCYKYIRDFIEQNHRESWITDETNEVYNENVYRINPDEAWRKIRHNIHSPKFLTALKYLAKWREQRAQKFNTPRQSILRDDVLINLASAKVQNINDLKQVRNLKTEIINGRLGAEILAALQQAQANPISSDECKTLYNNDLNIFPQDQSFIEVLRLILHIQCQKYKVVPRIVASENDLRCFVRAQDDKTKILSSWRYEIFGHYALKLREGTLSISYNPQTKSIQII